MKGQTKKAIELFDLPQGATILELGSGDGRVARLLAESGYKVVGYELNPILWLISLAWTWNYRKDVKIHLGDYWRASWPNADGIYVFLLDRFMQRLDDKIRLNSLSGVRVVSYAFKIPGRTPDTEKYGFYVYDYPKKRSS